MKTNFTLLLLFFSLAAYSQCSIIGNAAMKMGTRGSYSVTTTAQCDDCYTWKSTGLEFIENKTGNNVSVKAHTLGTIKISATVLTAGGVSECEKEILVTETAADSTEVNPNNSMAAEPCKITVKDFTDVKVGNNIISFFPDVNSSDYVYKWTAAYNNGDLKSSDEKIPQFPVSEGVLIKSVKLQIFSRYPICTVILNKTFAEEYWIPKKPARIEQRSYQPGFYSKESQTKKSEGSVTASEKKLK